MNELWVGARGPWARAFAALGAASLLATGAALSAGAADAGAPQDGGAQVVPTVTAAARTDGAGFTLDGHLQAQRQSTLAAQIGGNVLALAVRAGDRVKAGQPLVRIDDRDAQAALAAAQAGVIQAEAQQRNARVSAERSRELQAQGFVSQAALDQAETQRRAAEAGLNQAQAMRTQASVARGFSVVAAPYDAVVLATHVEPGDLAVPGRPLVTVYVPGALRAVVQVPASRSALVRSAARVQVDIGSGEGARTLLPVRRTELPSADPVSQTVEWRFDLAPADSAALAPGQAASVAFTGATPERGVAARLAIPASAVLRRGELTAVYAVADGRFVLKTVRLGARHGDAVEVLAGLRPGERVAADPVRAGLAGAVPASR